MSPFQTTVTSLKHETLIYSSETIISKSRLHVYQHKEIKSGIPMKERETCLLRHCYLFISMTTPEAVHVTEHIGDIFNYISL
jgi:hypothetical protein